MELELPEVAVHFAYVFAAALFVVGLHQMNSPVTARQGNLISAAGMLIAVVVTAIQLILRGSPVTGAVEGLAWPIIIVGALIGGGLGWYSARTVKMTAMPQLVSIFNAVGGGAAGLIAIEDYWTAVETAHADVWLTIFVVAGSILGAVAFSGSVIATGKLQGFISGAPIMFPGHRILTGALAIVALGGTVALVLGALGVVDVAGLELVILAGIVLSALAFGVTMVMPIGGADMPVVISLLNSGTGTSGRVCWPRAAQPGPDHRRRAGRRLGRDPDQADGRRDEPLGSQRDAGRLRRRVSGSWRSGERGGGSVREVGVDDAGDPARLRLEGDHRARLRAGCRPGAARRA
jgi:NAD/NADP transhydrogenase beta subunit